MATPKRDEKMLRKTLQAYIAANGVKDNAARALKVNDATYRGRLLDAVQRLGSEFGLTVEEVFPRHVAPAPPPTKVAQAFAVPKLPSGRRPIDAILAERKAATRANIDAKAARELIRVPVKARGPVGFALIGDPHIDDDGCDISRLEHDLDVIAKTDALFAVHVGDIVNGWAGRLARLWAHQSTSAQDAHELAQWMFDKAPPLIVVQGNHDLWEGPNAGIVDRVMRNHDGINGKHGVRVQFDFPGGLGYRLHTRHDFPGKSQFSDTHGMRRETLFGYRDHLLVAGHTHVDEARIIPINTDGLVATFVRVSGYKVADDYAEANRFLPKRMAPSVVAIVNPDARLAAEVTKLFWDFEAAADYLTWLRARKAA